MSIICYIESIDINNNIIVNFNNFTESYNSIKKIDNMYKKKLGNNIHSPFMSNKLKICIDNAIYLAAADGTELMNNGIGSYVVIYYYIRYYKADYIGYKIYARKIYKYL